jgi:retron-type reverse transcriptase
MKGDIADKRVLRRVNDYLRAGVMVNGVVMETEEGTPQGGPSTVPTKWQTSIVRA